LRNVAVADVVDDRVRRGARMMVATGLAVAFSVRKNSLDANSPAVIATESLKVFEAARDTDAVVLELADSARKNSLEATNDGVAVTDAVNGALVTNS
jgi:urease gamma subunit